MTTVLVLFSAGFGAIVGSFLNVVIYRLPRDEPLGLFRKSRSACPECGATIHWYDNVPLLSYAVLRGRCRACGWRIPLRYPLVEALNAALFAACAWRAIALDWRPLLVVILVSGSFSSLLLAAAAIDIRHQLLLDKLTLRAGPVIAVLGVLLIPALPGTVLFGHELAGASVKPGLASLLVALTGGAVGAGAVGLIRWLGSVVLRREAMGLGDVKLMGTCGLLLGPTGVLLALGVAFLVGAVLGLLIWGVTRRREIPFGPFLALGAWFVMLFADPIRYFVFVAYPGWFAG